MRSITEWCDGGTICITVIGAPAWWAINEEREFDMIRLFFAFVLCASVYHLLVLSSWFIHMLSHGIATWLVMVVHGLWFLQIEVWIMDAGSSLFRSNSGNKVPLQSTLDANHDSLTD